MQITFEDPRRCDGLRSPITAKPREVCTLCPARINAPGTSAHWVQPAAQQDDKGRWTLCTTRDSMAVHDEHSIDGKPAEGKPAERGAPESGDVCGSAHTGAK